LNSGRRLQDGLTGLDFLSIANRPRFVEFVQNGRGRPLRSKSVSGFVACRYFRF
jgi:hypothetical protein